MQHKGSCAVVVIDKVVEDKHRLGGTDIYFRKDSRFSRKFLSTRCSSRYLWVRGEVGSPNSFASVVVESKGKKQHHNSPVNFNNVFTIDITLYSSLQMHYFTMQSKIFNYLCMYIYLSFYLYLFQFLAVIGCALRLLCNIKWFHCGSLFIVMWCWSWCCCSQCRHTKCCRWLEQNVILHILRCNAWTRCTIIRKCSLNQLHYHHQLFHNSQSNTKLVNIVSSAANLPKVHQHLLLQVFSNFGTRKPPFICQTCYTSILPQGTRGLGTYTIRPQPLSLYSLWECPGKAVCQLDVADDLLFSIDQLEWWWKKLWPMFIYFFLLVYLTWTISD